MCMYMHKFVHVHAQTDMHISHLLVGQTLGSLLTLSRRTLEYLKRSEK
jgi:hypothetical protein